MARRFKHPRGGCRFDREPGIHYLHTVAASTDHRQVVRDKQQRQPALAAQPVQQLENLARNAGIQRGGGFVGDQQHGFAGQRHGNHGALLHAAREFVRIGARHPVCVIQADFDQQLA